MGPLNLWHIAWHVPEEALHFENRRRVLEFGTRSKSKIPRIRRSELSGGGGIPVYWIVNLVDRQLEVYANPIAGTYPAPTILGETDTVELVIDGQVAGRIAVADLLPRRP